ncbi:MAG: hypothetical protein Q4P78_07040 [Rothia sp. (in: high G+C Gram-positive bacteria)]|uniref:hypothetical protein n=1 Tax=Rothia sp. (in: high G+C Gram-positive bacteria) TaxID=1885016 RepID=UPI0026E005DF|nr:hypothetical protein [Rothia sp. (in: high G+C Gram-positive bacteria)]MDO5750938.1 hypothetical protein [Rothia sp. (in: high G+C Gram-positive bacteria)]
MTHSTLSRTVLAVSLAAGLALPASVAAQAAPAGTNVSSASESISMGLRGGSGLTLTEGDTGGYVGFTLMLNDPTQKVASLKVTLIEQSQERTIATLASETHSINEFNTSPFEGLEQVYSFTFSGTQITATHTYKLVFEAFDGQGNSVILPAVEDSQMRVLPMVQPPEPTETIQPEQPAPVEEPAPTEIPAPVVTENPTPAPEPAQTQQPVGQDSTSGWDFFTSLVGKVIKGFIGFLGHIFG